MILTSSGLGAFADWVQQSNWNSDTGTMDTYWYNRVTGEVSYTAPPPDPVATTSASPAVTYTAPPEYYVWARSGSDAGQWTNIANIAQGIQYIYNEPPSGAPPGIAVQFVGYVNESTLGLRGDVFKDSAGNYYINGARITNATPAQIQAAIAGQAVAIAQAEVANKSSWLDSPIAPLAVFALPLLVYGLPMLMATGTADAGAAAAGVSSDTTSALVEALNAQQAEQVALEQAIAAADAAPSATTVLDAANQANNAADALSNQAAQYSAATTDPGIQAAASQANDAANALKVAAGKAAGGAGGDPFTWGGLLTGLKGAAAAAGAAGTLISAVTRAKATAARPNVYVPPAGYKSPYLTQAGVGGTNQTMLLLAAGAAAFLLLKRK
jgi:hypothetical protein